MFDVTNIVKNSDKSKYVYNGYGMIFAEAGLWSIGNVFARSVLNCGVDNSSSFHTDNVKNIFLVVHEGPNGDIDDSV